MNSPFSSSSCPSCGNHLHFRIRESVAIVCPNCQTVVERKEGALTAMYVVPSMPDDMTLLRVGTTGTWGGREFTLMGRIRYHFEDGYENCWLMNFMEGKKSWLSESYGIYCVCEPVEYKLNAGSVKKLVRGNLVSTPFKEQMEVSAIRQCTRLIPEGELMDVPEMQLRFMSYELTGRSNSGAMATIDYLGGDKLETVEGRFIRFADLKLNNIRALHGWS